MQAVKTKGFSIAEVAIALFVIGVCVLPIFTVLNQGNTGTVQTRDEVMAYGYASDLLQSARCLDFDAPFLGSGRKDARQLPGPLSGEQMDPRFSRFLTVTEQTVPGSGFRYKSLTAEISWKSGGTDRQIQMVGLLSAGRNP